MDKPRETMTLVKDARPEWPATPKKPSTPPSREAIAKRAYELYECSGCQAGREVEFWLEAEKELCGIP